MNNIKTLLIVLVILTSAISSGCSMYKITKDGKTIVGNNEDWLSPNHQFWYESGSEDKLGVMYMGQLNDFAQGAFNEAGLMFDGFFEPSNLPVNNTAGKLEIPIGTAIEKVMQTMKQVEEVKFYLETINLSSLKNGMLVFVDESGTYLIVEGDEMFMGDEPEKTFSNFYYSEVDSEEDVNLDYYQSGRQFINSTDSKASLDYCGEAMNKFAQSKKIAVTQYTTVYDLNKLKIRVYLFQDQDHFVEIDLSKELKKGDHKIMIPELFSKESEGYKHYTKYNDVEKPTLFIEDLIGSETIAEAEYLAMGFDAIINPIGYEWLYDKKNPKGAIKVFEYGVSLMPSNANLYDSLGEAYFEDGDCNNAIKNYEKSLELNPDNEHAVEMISRCKNNK